MPMCYFMGSSERLYDSFPLQPVIFQLIFPEPWLSHLAYIHSLVWSNHKADNVDTACWVSHFCFVLTKFTKWPSSLSPWEGIINCNQTDARKAHSQYCHPAALGSWSTDWHCFNMWEISLLTKWEILRSHTWTYIGATSQRAKTSGRAHLRQTSPLGILNMTSMRLALNRPTRIITCPQRTGPYKAKNVPVDTTLTHGPARAPRHKVHIQPRFIWCSQALCARLLHKRKCMYSPAIAGGRRHSALSRAPSSAQGGECCTA